MTGLQLVPNTNRLEINAEFAHPSGRNLLIIGECPTLQDIKEGKHFTGAMSELLWKPLQRLGVNRTLVSMCYLIRHNTQLTAANYHQLVNDNLEYLKTVIDQVKPNLILFVGPFAFRLAKPDFKNNKLTDWRGSLFVCEDKLSPAFGYKCLGVHAPHELARDWSKWAIYRLDLARAVKQSEFPELSLMARLHDNFVSSDEAVRRLDSLTNTQHPITLDIEGGVTTGATCISFATGSSYAFCIPLETYSDAELSHVLPALSRFLSSGTPKILQNSLYDNFVLSWTHKSPICNVVHDTMLSGWEIYPELPKGLGTQLSIWTDIPYYKSERLSEDRMTYYTYCCKDSTGTHELFERHSKVLESRPSGLDHFRENMSLLVPFLYMELRGIRYNKNLAMVELTTVEQKLTAFQALINATAAQVSSGSITSVNPRSPAQLKDLLYTQLHYPIQYSKKRVDGEMVSSDTTNVDALLALKQLFTGPQHAILDHILGNRKFEEIRKQLSTETDPDGRVRCAYNIVGTDTGRLTCYGSPTGSGSNLQTITKKLRHLYCADQGYVFFQCDLAGADGWTVAAHCARLGDPTMLDDYYFGLKPAKIIALLYTHGSVVNTWSRDQLKEASKGITEEGEMGWLYFACKRVQHGSNYGLGRKRMSIQILKDSYKLLGRAIVVSERDCSTLQELYHLRYLGVKRWQQYIKDILQTNPVLPCASGHTRHFFGRREDHETYTAMLSHEPQANTTFATNRALRQLWADPENRRNGSLIIEPLHQVHDALCGQFPKEVTEWACKKIKQYFNNPIQIAGMSIVIPFDGGYGPSWGELPNKL